MRLVKNQTPEEITQKLERHIRRLVMTDDLAGLHRTQHCFRCRGKSLLLFLGFDEPRRETAWQV